MKQVNLRELYPDAYVDDEYVDVSNEVYERSASLRGKTKRLTAANTGTRPFTRSTPVTGLKTMRFYLRKHRKK